MKKFLAIALFAATLTACKTTKKTTKSDIETLAPIEVIGKKLDYKASAEQAFDLIHTKLNVSFSWEKQHLFGEATLSMKPYFYPTNLLELDAKQMKIEEVSLVNSNGTKQELQYSYDNKVIKIALDKTYSKEDLLTVYIKYISKPNEIKKADGLSAISDDKGLFFINPLGEDKNKPQQIWTQGEPESNSVWFPTFDHPNARTTQELAITVDKKYRAMSNGYIASNIDNGDGTYTITWKQDIPHAPYLLSLIHI